MSVRSPVRSLARLLHPGPMGLFRREDQILEVRPRANALGCRSRRRIGLRRAGRSEQVPRLRWDEQWFAGPQAIPLNTGKNPRYHRRRRRRPTKLIHVPTVLVGSSLEAPVAGCHHFASPALDVDTVSEVREVQSRAIRTEARRGSPGAYEDRAGVAIGSIEGILPAGTEGRCGRVIDGIVEIHGAVARGFHDQNLASRRIDDRIEIIGPPLHGDLFGPADEWWPFTLQLEQDDVARTECERGLVYGGRCLDRSGDRGRRHAKRPSRDAGDGGVWTDALDPERIRVATEDSHDGGTVISLSQNVGRESSDDTPPVRQEVLVSEAPLTLHIDDADVEARTSRPGPRIGRVDTTRWGTKILLFSAQVGRRDRRRPGQGRADIGLGKARRIGGQLDIGAVNGRQAQQAGYELGEALLLCIDGVVDRQVGHTDLPRRLKTPGFVAEALRTLSEQRARGHPGRASQLFKSARLRAGVDHYDQLTSGDVVDAVHRS